ncbi:MAG: class II aldolase/adducin family protein [Gemmatimonas sp.]
MHGKKDGKRDGKQNPRRKTSTPTRLALRGGNGQRTTRTTPKSPARNPATARSAMPRRGIRARDMSEAEWRTRLDLAACYRLIAHYEMDDLFATHISARVPGTEHFLLNPLGVMFSQVTASSLVKVDLAGTVIFPKGALINQAGFVIHSAVHGARPDVACVIHTHTVAGMAVAAMKEGLLPLCQKAMRFHGRLATHDFEGKATNLDERARLVRDLGTENAMILRNHGLLTCGPTIVQAFKRMFALEKSCKTQLAALATGRPLEMLSANLLEYTATQFDHDDVPSATRPSGWESLLDMLDRIDPSYRD